MNARAQAVGIVVWLVIICLVSYGTTGSVNPVAVYGRPGTAMKVVMSLLLLMLATQLLQLLVSRLVSGRCSGCGLPLVPYAQTHGAPVRCTKCGKWYHQKCFKQRGGTMMEGCGCQRREATSWWDEG